MSIPLKLNLSLGANGWQHSHWMDDFYPDDLPEDWRLTYYSNEFNSILLPVSCWQSESEPDCDDWLDNVHEEFEFFVECRGDMFEHVSREVLVGCLQALQPQLSGLVFLDNKQNMSEQVHGQFIELFKQVDVAVFSTNPSLFSAQREIQLKSIWQQAQLQGSSFAFIENDLTDLRAARVIVDDFVNSLADADETIEKATLIVSHAQLQPQNLSKFRQLIEVMGY